MNLMSGRIRVSSRSADAVERSGRMVGDQDGSRRRGCVVRRIGFVTDAQGVECCGCSVAGYFRVRLPAGSFVGSAGAAVARVKRIAVQPIDAMKTCQTH